MATVSDATEENGKSFDEWKSFIINGLEDHASNFTNHDSAHEHLLNCSKCKEFMISNDFIPSFYFRVMAHNDPTSDQWNCPSDHCVKCLLWVGAVRHGGSWRAGMAPRVANPQGRRR
jgi:hypothetical protein